MIKKVKFRSNLSDSIKELKGIHLKSMYFQKASISNLSRLDISGIGDFYLNGLKPNKIGVNQHVSINGIPFGRESIAGDLTGFDFQFKSKRGTYENLGYPINFLFDWENSKVEKVVHLGQVIDTPIRDKETIDFWFKSANQKPNLIELDIISFDLLAISISSGKWLYICSNGNLNFNVFPNCELDLKEFIEFRQYLLAGIKLKLIEEI